MSEEQKDANRGLTFADALEIQSEIMMWQAGPFFTNLISAIKMLLSVMCGTHRLVFIFDGWSLLECPPRSF